MNLRGFKPINARCSGVQSIALCAPNRRTYRELSAFTLIEVVISSALMALILASAYLCLHASISTQRTAEPRLEVIQNARVAMTLLAADLRNACPLSREYDFLGMRRVLGETVDADNLDFGTHNFTPHRPGEGDFCQTSYYVEQDIETGQFLLMRRRHAGLGLDPLSGGRQEEIARGLAGVRFEYYDGYYWWDSWGELNPERRQGSQSTMSNLTGMPEAVRVTLMFDSDPRRIRKPEEPPTPTTEPPLVFQTIVRLNLAGVSSQSGSGTSSSSSSGEAGSSSGAQPGAPAGGEGGN